MSLDNLHVKRKIENYYDITTDSINGRLCSSFTAITNNDDISKKIFALKDNVKDLTYFIG